MGAFRGWLAGTGLLILAGIAVPYGLLPGDEPSFAVLIFWCLFAVAVIGAILVGISGWRR
ncbi:hypothetical protein RM543_11925 [Roseicyclus sp. F158]|uniref:DUF4175 domain-containing protein n=1 Tax=Tropicimonas omnivorans TaxID=3075590 RepID=A0ABU3DJV5_9RHOB|nr:hypothetical protein [Roseicyclus sp. F158]MDT0683397.1 hypothetical protein [Roseicyclus sp. F158]